MTSDLGLHCSPLTPLGLSRLNLVEVNLDTINLHVRRSTMEKCGSVQQKISCIFETAVLDEQSGKREHQPFKVMSYLPY